MNNDLLNKEIIRLFDSVICAAAGIAKQRGKRTRAMAVFTVGSKCSRVSLLGSPAFKRGKYST